jgi:hypothetical protein
VQLLLSNALPAGHTVYVPGIVELEMVKHFREDLKSAVNDVDRYLGRTSQVLRRSIDSSFPSAEAMEWVLATGTDVGRTQAVGQIDAILAEQTIQR